MKFELWYPLKPFILTQKFGENKVNYRKLLGLNGHPGWDMVGETGQIIRAAHNGIVMAVEQDGRGGLGIVLRTLATYDYEGDQVFFKTVYWHCLPGSIVVSIDQIVKAGDFLGRCDSTGVRIGTNLPTDSHLHFGLKPAVLKTKFNIPGEDAGGSYYANLKQDNGYGGAIDPEPFFNKFYAEDQTFILGTYNKIIELLKNFLSRFQ